MPRDGSGNFNRLNNWAADAAAGPPDSIISSAKFDNENNDFAAGLTQSIATDGQSTITANIPFSGNRPTNIGDPVGPQDAASKNYVDTTRQPVDATLTSLAATATMADTFPYTTGVDTYAEAPISAQGRNILAQVTPTSQRTEIGLPDGVQGEIRYFTTGASPALLPVGTAGEVLTTQGPGADPVWAPAIRPGTVFMTAGPTVPAGWLLCDGSAVSRTTYAALFGEIGTTWGAGDGTTTFNLPPGGVFPMAAGTGTHAGATARNVGDSGGAETHKLTAAQSGLPQHNVSHPRRADAQAGGQDNNRISLANTNGQAGTFTVTVAAQGAAEAHPIMNPFATFNFIIKT